jgi:hypothetical protein
MTAMLEALEERDRTILAMTIARTWRDHELKARLVADPKSVLAEEGIQLREDLEIRVVEDTDTVKHINLHWDKSDPDSALEVIKSALPIPAGYELRIVQSTWDLFYLVLPEEPKDIDPVMITDTDIMMAAAVPNVPYAKVYLYQYAAVGVAAAADVVVGIVAVLT